MCQYGNMWNSHVKKQSFGNFMCCVLSTCSNSDRHIIKINHIQYVTSDTLNFSFLCEYWAIHVQMWNSVCKEANLMWFHELYFISTCEKKKRKKRKKKWKCMFHMREFVHEKRGDYLQKCPGHMRLYFLYMWKQSIYMCNWDFRGLWLRGRASILLSECCWFLWFKCPWARYWTQTVPDVLVSTLPPPSVYACMYELP